MTLAVGLFFPTLDDLREALGLSDEYTIESVYYDPLISSLTLRVTGKGLVNHFAGTELLRVNWHDVAKRKIEVKR